MNRYVLLGFISFIILFLELLLIRLIGTEVRIFAYLSNLVLLATFIGAGMGMFIKKKLPLIMTPIFLFLLVFCIILGVFSNITNLISPLSESFIWFQTDKGSFINIIGGLLLTITLFFMILLIFIPLGQYLGEIFNTTKKPIILYSIDICMSLVGMWVFQLMSVLNVSPFIGIILIQILFIFLMQVWQQRTNVIILVLLTITIVVLASNSQLQKTIWSPYQKLTLFELPHNQLQPFGYLLQVNNVGYMGLLDLSDQYKTKLTKKIKNEKLPNTFDMRFANQYDLPYIMKRDSKNVLIVGAGGGNDVAAAVRAKIPSIDAVEIDPKIVALGKEYHPEHPYSAKAVRVTIDDGRSFFKKTDKKYDLVIMGLADSHTLTSSLNNVQLDNYLYTKESFEEIKKILNPEGLLFISFDVRRSWIGARLQNGLSTTFGTSPIIFTMQKEYPFFGWGGVIFITGSDKGVINRYLSQNKDLEKFVRQRQVTYNNQINPLSDNWPYLYLDKPRIPTIHILVSVLLIGLFLSLRKTISWQGRFRFDSFWLGTGFLLYEFQSISKTALLFGNTWITNLYTISAILLLILLANLVYAKWQVSLRISYIGLFLSFILQIFVPLSTLNYLPFYAKITSGIILLNLPLFFSALIFISFFTNTKEKSSVFASNIIGAATGGMLGVFSYLLGVQSLLFISLFLYMLSFTSSKKS